jgi:hypothetical protein
MYTTTQHININVNHVHIIYAPCSFKRSLFALTLRMAYSKFEQKSNKDKKSSCVKTFLTGNVSEFDYMDSTIGFTEIHRYSIFFQQDMSLRFFV